MENAAGLARTVALADGTRCPAFGVGTWRMGETAPQRGAELAALQAAIEAGVRLIDTAEMYGEGGAEKIVGEAIQGRRDGLFIVSKVYPQNASRAGVAAACERSLQRLGIERIDLYLLHWRGGHALAETVAGFEALKRQGKIGAWGVSNFDVEDMEELHAVPGGRNCATNQVLYNLARRGIEAGLLGWSRQHAMPVMAYSPLEQARIPANHALVQVAARHRATLAQIMLAFAVRDGTTIAIPKSTRTAHLRENIAALDVVLDAADMAALDKAFPPPKRRAPLDML